MAGHLQHHRRYLRLPAYPCTDVGGRRHRTPGTLYLHSLRPDVPSDGISIFLPLWRTAVYPRELAGTEFVPFEAYMSQITEFAGIDAEDWPTLFLQARQFVGNEQMGYKTALCQRDMAIFGALFSGMLYAVLRKRRTVKPLPFLWFVIIGMGPIALDGFSQLFGYYGELLPFLDFITLRESPPLTRTLTGAWFGLCVAWMVLPSIDRGVRANEAEAARRAARLQSATEAAIVDALNRMNCNVWIKKKPVL